MNNEKLLKAFLHVLSILLLIVVTIGFLENDISIILVIAGVFSYVLISLFINSD